jgi:ACS family hexuronate transporter-like MFS transporter
MRLLLQINNDNMPVSELPQHTNQTKTHSYRWVMVSLLFFATTINYLDRQVIGLLKDTLQADFNWSEKDYSNIVTAFSAAYAIGLLIFGRLIDAWGTKLGYTLSVVWWSLAAMAHALAKSTFGFGIARAGLGLGEAGNFPAAIKAVAEWFPKKERAFATGIFNSGSNVAAMIGPPLVAWILMNYGWQEAFIWTGAVGFFWLFFWLWLYQVPSRHKKVSAQELQYINSDEKDTEATVQKMSWSSLLRVRQTWTFILGKMLTDPVWWFYLFWIPSYINTNFGIDIKKSAIYISIIYTAASFGSIFGGYLSGLLIKRGLAPEKARKTAMLLFAICVVPIVFIQYSTNITITVTLISIAAAAHQAWSANIYTTVSDYFPKTAVSSVVGIGSMAGSVGGILFPLFIGWLLDLYKQKGALMSGYNIIFVICGVAYVFAWLIMHLLSKRKVNS